MFEDNGNKCGKCQNHDYEVLKKGHARDCPFKKCDCLKCRLLDARSDILQVISGKETKLKGTKKDPNCGFCQNHGVKILRKGHVRSCGFGQERHFRLDNCFSCEVHYIRNEVNRLQIKMRRAMKEDRTLSEEQRKTAREAITRDEVEKVCEMARLARRKRGALVPAAQLASGESSAGSATPWAAHCSYHSPSPSGAAASLVLVKEERRTPTTTFGGDAADATTTPLGIGPLRVQKCRRARQQLVKQQQQPYTHHDQVASSASVWRPWSQQQQQIVAAIAAHQQQQQQAHLPLPHPHLRHQQLIHLQQAEMAAMGDQSAQFGRAMFASGTPNSNINRATSGMGNSVGGGGNQISRLFSQQNHNNHQQQQHLQTISNFNSPLVAQPQPHQQLYQPVNLQCDNSQLASRGLGGGGGLLALPPPPPPLNSRSETPHQAGAHTAGPLGGSFNSAAMLQSNMLLNSALHHQQHHNQQQLRQYSDDKALVPATGPSRVASPLETSQLDILGSPEPTYLSGQQSRSPSVQSLSPIADAANMSIHITCAPSFPPPPPSATANLMQMQSEEQPQLSQRAAQEQQVFNTLFRLLVAQFTQQQQQQQNTRR